MPKGGPDGGDGGDGGSAYIEAVRDIRILERYKQGDVLQAEDGKPGSGGLCRGKNGKDLIVQVPVGSVIRNTATHEIFEMTEEGQRVLVAVGSVGGRGNAHFKSSTNTTPKTATVGEPAQSYEFHIELHIIADVGIIGLPNAGKSTLLNEITGASAKIAAYPFTTLEPNLGVFHRYVLADIPGLIEHASEGKGLGYTFLRHISRTRVLLHLVSAENPDIEAAYRTIRKELAVYDSNLSQKREIVVLSKTDLVDEGTVASLLASLPEGTLQLSILDDSSIEALKKTLSRVLSDIDAEKENTTET